MKAALVYNLSSPSPSPSPLVKHKLSSKPQLFANHPPAYSLKFPWPGQQCKSGCVASGSAAELEADEIMKAEAEELLNLRNTRDKCKERKGIVELLECLEREAIMGDDEGKEPTDYNRRALIFDKSSRVFQALKDPTL